MEVVFFFCVFLRVDVGAFVVPVDDFVVDVGAFVVPAGAFVVPVSICLHIEVF